MKNSYWNTTGISSRFIRELQRYCLMSDQIEKVLLFGSRARGDYHRASDIDLAVFTSNSSPTEQNLIVQTIQELPTPLKIDVVFMDRLTKEKLISNIKSEGVVIYEQGQALREA
ncbi:nucleotidyltransferase domain-containing protein [Mesobacillus maritimus]|uniref:nucleotidyltransferase domain-containing protein n=1 Tax=Mesobacillus maritimus TaxID=1643336 RepID=UPI00203AD9DF|nr:nucleotidyltransferase domain-containing protein [Mesobacillus maritimus]